MSAVRDFPVPRNPKNIKQFLGLAGCYRRFIPNFSLTASPLSKLLKKNTPFTWTSDQQNAFNTLKTALCRELMLQYPDFSQPFVLTTDASNFAIGGVLQSRSNRSRPSYCLRVSRVEFCRIKLPYYRRKITCRNIQRTPFSAVFVWTRIYSGNTSPTSHIVIQC